MPSEFACTIPLQRPTWDVIQNFHHKDNIKHAVPHRNHTCVSLNYANPTIFELKTSKSVTIDADADHSKSSVPCEPRKTSCFSAYVHRGFDAQLQKRLRNEPSPSLSLHLCKVFAHSCFSRFFPNASPLKCPSCPRTHSILLLYRNGLISTSTGKRESFRPQFGHFPSCALMTSSGGLSSAPSYNTQPQPWQTTR